MINVPAPITDAENAQVVFKHYQLGARLDQGGAGAVMAAWDQVLQRHVAIKRVRAVTGQVPESIASLVGQGRAGASLEHPAFVKVHAVEDDQDGYALVMERVHGVTLRELIARGPVPLDTALDLIVQAASAMQAAHALTLVHGDLKPSNLMIDEGGALRILDLGLAFHDDAQGTTSVLQLDQQGTIAYLAPERLLGTAPGLRADVYALGVVLYEMIGGQRPFPALSGLALAAAQMQSSSAQWPFPAGLPERIVDLILMMTARRPELRLPSMHQVLAQVAACRSEARRGRLPAIWRRMRATPTRRWLLPAAAALLIAAGVAALVRKPWQPAASFSHALTISQALHALESFDQPDQLAVAGAGMATLLARDPHHPAAMAGMSLVDSLGYVADTRDATRLVRAAASARQALALEPSLALALAANAWVLANQGQRTAALAAAERALMLDPDDFFAQLGKITVLTQLQRFDEAATTAAGALARHPHPAFSEALGTVHYAQGKYAEAEQDFRRSIALQPEAGTAYAQLSATLLRLDRPDEALRVLQRGLLVRPSARLYTDLGNALFARAEFAAAAAAFTRAVSAPGGNPDSYLGWANLADTLQLLPARNDDAQRAYERARALLALELVRTPHDPALLSRMGLYAARSADPATALRDTALAVQGAPTSPEVRFRAALAYELLHRRGLALTELAAAKRAGYPAAAIETAPDFADLRRDPRYPAAVLAP
jgi:tetratricopeptide (TPR) repeat protein